MKKYILWQRFLDDKICFTTLQNYHSYIMNDFEIKVFPNDFKSFTEVLCYLSTYCKIDINEIEVRG